MVSERVKIHALLLLVASLLSWLYVSQMVQKATLTLQLETTKKTILKVYWPNDKGLYTEEQMSKIVIRPGQDWYSLRICDLAREKIIRLDTSEKPAIVTLKRLGLKQPGFPPLIIASPAGWGQFMPVQGIKTLINGPDGLQVIPATGDPQLVFTLPEFDYHVPWILELTRIGLIFLLVYALAFACQPLWRDFSYLPLLMCCILTLVFVMAAISRFDTHPDEPVHVAAASYYQNHSLPPKIGDPAIRHTYSAYGVSRLHSGEIVYLFAGKFVRLLSSFHLHPYQSFRYFNTILFVILVLMSLYAVPKKLIVLPLLISPQIWYVFSYADSDAFALFILLIAAYQVCLPTSAFNVFLEKGLSRKTIAPLLLLGLLTGLSLLVKKNFYFFHLFLVGYLGWRLCFFEQKKKIFLLRCLLVGIVGLFCAGLWWGADYYVNGFDRSAKLLKCREKFAMKMYKPSTPLHKKHMYLQMKERGTTLQHFRHIDRWGEKSFRSSFGVYGYTTVSASFTYYDFVRFTGLALLIGIMVVLVTRGGLPGVTLFLLTAAASLSLLVVAMYHAWTVDFQAQGRYFLPMVPMFAVLANKTERCFRNPVIQLMILAMFFLSVYNFIFVGMQGVAKF